MVQTIVLFATTMIMYIAMAAAVVRKVGDSQGWSLGRINYDEWSSSNKFYVGDTIVFEYSSTHHNVIQVTHRDYILCKSASPPIAAYLSGNAKITFNKSGEYFYFCNWPGHCEAGQKVAVRVLDPPIASPSDSTTLPATAPVSVPVPAPLVVDLVDSPEASPSASVEPALARSNSVSLYSLRNHAICFIMGLLVSIGRVAY